MKQIEDTKQNRELAQQLLQEYIKTNNVDFIERILKTASILNIPRELLFEGNLLCGNFYLQKANFVESIKYFNQARSINATDIDLIQKCIAAFKGFYYQLQAEFTRNDLIKLIGAAKFFIHNVEYNIPNSNEITQPLVELIKEINIQKVIAPDEIETKATFRNDIVCRSFTEPKTYQEVLENFAFIAEDDLRIFYESEEEESEDKPSKDKTNSKEEKDNDSEE